MEILGDFENPVSRFILAGGVELAVKVEKG